MTKYFRIALLLLFIPYIGFAQPISGIKVGINQTFIKDNNYYNYQSGTGFSLAYQKAFKLTDQFYVSVGAGYSILNAEETQTTQIYPLSFKSKLSEESFIAPLTAYYAFNKLFIKGGYQYGYIFDVSILGNGISFSNNIHNHNLFTGIGYNFGRISCCIDYMHHLNRSKTTNAVDYGSSLVNIPVKMNTLQLTATIRLGKNN